MDVQTIIAKFVEDLTAAIRAETLASLQAALGQTTGFWQDKTKKKTKSVTTSKIKAKAKGKKRTGAELGQFLAEIEKTVEQSPDIRADEIALKLGVPTKDLALPIKKLLEAKCLSKKGQRRGTTYRVKSAGAWRRI